MCSREQCDADHDDTSHTNEDINSNSTTLGQKFCENSKTSVCLTYFDGSSYIKKPKARLKKRSSQKPFAESSDTNVRNTINKCQNCCDNDRKRSEEDAGAAEPASSARTVPADACVRMVGGRVREILDLLARSDGDMACADARRLQRLLKSVIRALDDLRADCCRTPPRQIIPPRDPRENGTRLSGAGGGSEPPSPSEVDQRCRHRHDVCNQRAAANLEELIKAAANFGCLYGHAIDWETAQRR